MNRYPRPDLSRSPGTYWEASYDPTLFSFIGQLDEDRRFFFRELRLNLDKQWWQFWKPSWVYTGKIWEGVNMKAGGFKLLGGF